MEVFKIIDRAKKDSYFLLVMQLVGHNLQELKKSRPEKVFFSWRAFPETHSSQEVKILSICTWSLLTEHLFGTSLKPFHSSLSLLPKKESLTNKTRKKTFLVKQDITPWSPILVDDVAYLQWKTFHLNTKILCVVNSAARTPELLFNKKNQSPIL